MSPSENPPVQGDGQCSNNENALNNASGVRFLPVKVEVPAGLDMNRPEGVQEIRMRLIGGNQFCPGGASGASPPPPPAPRNDLSFEDCGGLETQVRYLQNAVIMPMTNRAKQIKSRFPMDPTKGVLFYGPPGTGKTRLALALANELKKSFGTRQQVTFIYRKGKDVASKFVGASSANLRAVFSQAKLYAPSIIFFDELDGLCPNRDAVGFQPTIDIVTTMLGQMDELPNDGKVFVIGATNRLEAIDPAIRRPGRFDKHLEFFPPPEAGRLDILKIHTKQWKVQPSEDFLKGISKETAGYSGADLAKLSIDAFDNALQRFTSKLEDPFSAQVNYDGLRVEEKDWMAALHKMRPTNAAIFGSTLYTPPRPAAKYLAELLEPHVSGVVKKIEELLHPKSSILNFNNGSIKSLHVYQKTESVLGSTDELVISEALRSPKLGNFRVYTINCSILSALPRKDWSNKVDAAFTQAIGAPQSSILYIQQIDDLTQLIQDSGVQLVVNFKAEMERLRGQSVLLLTSGYQHSSKLKADSPFQKVLNSSCSSTFEIGQPRSQERKDLFEHLLALALLLNGDKWSSEDSEIMGQVLEQLITWTNGLHLGQVITLYDLLKFHLDTETSKLAVDPKGSKACKDIMKMLLTVAGGYRMHAILPNHSGDDGNDLDGSDDDGDDMDDD